MPPRVLSRNRKAGSKCFKSNQITSGPPRGELIPFLLAWCQDLKAHPGSDSTGEAFIGTQYQVEGWAKKQQHKSSAPKFLLVVSNGTGATPKKKKIGRGSWLLCVCVCFKVGSLFPLKYSSQVNQKDKPNVNREKEEFLSYGSFGLRKDDYKAFGISIYELATS